MDSTNIDEEISKIMNSKNEKKSKKKIGKKTKITLIILGFLILLFIISNALNSKKAKIPMVDSKILSKSHIENSILVSGIVGGTDSVTITSGIHAKINEINVKEGDKVFAKKTVLAKIDTTDLKTKVETAKGAYKLALAQKEDRLRADTLAHTKAKEAQRLANLDYERKKTLFDAGLISLAELETVQNNLLIANTELAQYKFKNGKIEIPASYDINIENAKIELERLEKEMEGATLIAPIDGTVTRVYAKVGRFADQAINNNPTLIIIEKLDKLDLNVDISEYNINKVKLGQKVLISADILGKGNEILGKVEKISPSGEVKSSSTNERVIPVKISISDKGNLISGINAKAKIVNEEKNDVYVVPISAIYYDENKKSFMQFIEEKNKSKGIVKIVEVETGIESDIDIEIKAIKDLDTSKELRYITKYDNTLSQNTVVDYSSMQLINDNINKK